jgi:poly(A) polymerase
MPNLPVILPRSKHPISRKRIDENTLKVLYRLRRHGFKAFLVGGSVRDLLLERIPKDFDVGTDATPNQVKRLFRNCFLVGRRFRLAHIRFGRDNLVEVATFRRQASEEERPRNPADLFFFSENVFGTPQEDAFRRDFTINALFYDIEDFSIIDYVGGLEDLAVRRLRAVGDPLIRFTEDPVRMLRALEFVARLDFSLEEAAREAIYACAPLIAEAAPARIREELMELFRHQVAGAVLRNAQAMGLLPHLLPGFEGDRETFDLLERVDARTASGVPIEEHFILAALCLSRFRRTCPLGGEIIVADVVRFADLVLSSHCDYFHVARGTRHLARELLVGFSRLCRGRGKRGERRFLQHPLTSQTLQLLTLWAEATGKRKQQVAAWQEVLPPSEASPQRLGISMAPHRTRRRKKGRRG